MAHLEDDIECHRVFRKRRFRLASEFRTGNGVDRQEGVDDLIDVVRRRLEAFDDEFPEGGFFADGERVRRLVIVEKRSRLRCGNILYDEDFFPVCGIFGNGIEKAFRRPAPHIGDSYEDSCGASGIRKDDEIIAVRHVDDRRYGIRVPDGSELRYRVSQARIRLSLRFFVHQGLYRFSRDSYRAR